MPPQCLARSSLSLSPSLCCALSLTFPRSPSLPQARILSVPPSQVKCSPLCPIFPARLLETCRSHEHHRPSACCFEKPAIKDHTHRVAGVAGPQSGPCSCWEIFLPYDSWYIRFLTFYVSGMLMLLFTRVRCCSRADIFWWPGHNLTTPCKLATWDYSHTDDPQAAP